jgi:hypothetical protein
LIAESIAARSGTSRAVLAACPSSRRCQGNRVRESCGDEACEEVIIPSGDRLSYGRNRPGARPSAPRSPPSRRGSSSPTSPTAQSAAGVGAGRLSSAGALTHDHRVRSRAGQKSRSRLGSLTAAAGLNRGAAASTDREDTTAPARKPILMALVEGAPLLTRAADAQGRS